MDRWEAELDLKNSKHQVRAAQIGILVTALVAWQYLPYIKPLANFSHVFDSFFISSPSRVAIRLYDLFTGANGTTEVWSYLFPTVEASLLGLLFGLLVGGFVGLVFSNFDFLARVFQPFIVVLNAIPRIALIPIVIVIFGPTFSSSVVLSFMVVVFVAFYSAFEGGRSVRRVQLNSVRLLGANSWQLVFRVRFNYVAAWVLTSLPVAATFALLTVVTSEILTGVHGLGALISVAGNEADATLSFAVAIVTAAVGLIIVGLGAWLRRIVLHWWDQQ